MPSVPKLSPEARQRIITIKRARQRMRVGCDNPVRGLVVILETQVRDQRLSAQMAQCVLQLHELDEEIVLGIETGSRHGRLQVKAEPFLDSQAAQFVAALRQ